MPLKAPFVSAFGKLQDKEIFIIELTCQDGVSGWGESTAFTAPWYTEETTTTVYHMLTEFLIPLVRKAPFQHPSEFVARTKNIRGNPMAKATIDSALWDLYAKRQGKSLAAVFGGERSAVDVGVAVGLHSSLEGTLTTIEQRLQEGYRRIKLKVVPREETDLLRSVRAEFPHIELMIDVNSAYTINDQEHLKKLDEFRLLMIEQPLAQNDFVDHASLQSVISTPICLDESIRSLADVRTAHTLGSCQVINVKPSRVGGFTESLAIHQYCRDHGIDLWCGGMLETGIGRAQNIALASLPGFTLPGDLSGSARYWERDLVKPAFVAEYGQMQVPDKPGIGVDIDFDTLDFFAEWQQDL